MASLDEPVNGHTNGVAALATLPDLPEEAWAPPLDRYRDLVCRDSEAPEAYHWASAVVLIGQLFGRRVCQYYAGDIFLNFQFVLIGATGIKKSTPINLAPRLFREICDREGVGTLWGVSTGEGLLSKFAENEDTRLVVCLNELRALFVRAKRDGNQQLGSILIELMDAGDKVDNPTKSNPITAVRPFMSLLSAATPESLEDAINDNDVYGGLLNRILPIGGVPGGAQPFPEKPDSIAVNALVGVIDDLVTRYGGPTEIRLEKNSDAGELWASWYQRYYERQTGGAQQDGLTALSQRQHTHVRRLALLFAALRGATRIDVEDLQRALTLVLTYFHPILERVLQPITVDAHRRLDVKIERILREKPMTKRRLHQKLSGRIKGGDFQRALSILIDLQSVVEVTDGMGGKVMLKWSDSDD